MAPSPGGRGHTPFDRTMEDIAACLAEARDRVPDVPRFLYGHSLGGLLVLTYALRLKPDLAGVVVSSAALAQPRPRATAEDDCSQGARLHAADDRHPFRPGRHRAVAGPGRDRGVPG